MSSLKASLQRQGFLLGPEREASNMTSSSSLTQNSGRDPKARKEKMNMFRRHLASSRLRSDDAIRRKVEMLKEQRSLSNLSKSGIQKDMEAESRARLEEELGRPMSNNDWPFVYFVVTLDHLPKDVEELNGQQSNRVKERHRFLTSRRKKLQEAREENERIREAGIDMGLRLEPIKPQVPEPPPIQKTRTRPSLSRHPPTPASSIGSRPEFSYLNSHDDLMDNEMTRRNLGYIISDTLSQAGMPPKNGRHCPINSLELPEISASAKRRALGVSHKTRNVFGERKVTFADSLPVIKGSGIAVANNAVSSSLPNMPNREDSSLMTNSHPPSRERVDKDIKKRDDEKSRASWSTPMSRSLSNLGPRSRLFTPMALPKVDIVSEIYDELIVKTIQNYLLAEGYSDEKLQQLRQTVLARLSATYPHLVKHKAWRLTHSPCDKLFTPDEEGEEVLMADPDKLQPRPRTRGRYNKIMLEKDLTYDQLRPVTSPHVSPTHNEITINNLMAVDGRPVTLSSREDVKNKSPTGGALGSPDGKQQEKDRENNNDGGDELDNGIQVEDVETKAATIGSKDNIETIVDKNDGNVKNSFDKNDNKELVENEDMQSGEPVPKINIGDDETGESFE